MSDELPSGDKAVYVFIEMIALGFVLYSIEEAFKNNPDWPKVLVAVVLGLVFFVFGIKWTRLKHVLGFTVSSWIQTVANDYRYRYGLALVLCGLSGAYMIVYMRSLRNDLNTFMMPRTVSKAQSDTLRQVLSNREPHEVTVKVNPLDQEATEYAGQLFAALKQTNWDATFDTSNTDPNTLNSGLCIEQLGINVGPPDPKHDPASLLQSALQSSHLDVNCSGSVGAGSYRLFLVVGHRPLKLGDQRPVLYRFGQWIQGLQD